MKPLCVELKDRCGRLKEIRESLWNLEIEAFPLDIVERLSIDFCHLDIDTGATSDSITPYYLPRPSFPSCRDLEPDGLRDPIIDEGRNRDPDIKYDSSAHNRFFPTCLGLVEKFYGAKLQRDLMHRIMRKELVSPNT